MSYDTTQGNDFFRRAILRRWGWIALFGVIGLLLGGLTFVVSPKEYTSTANVFLNPLVGNPFSPTTPTSRSEQLAAMTTESGVVLTDDVLDAAIAKSGVDNATRQSMRQGTMAEVPSNSQVMNISFTSTDPKEAQSGAQTITESFLEFRTQRAQSVIKSQSQLLTTREEAVNALLQTANSAYNVARKSGADQARVIDLEQQVRLYAQELANVKVDRTTTETSSIDPGNIVGPASAPQEPIGIDPLLLAVAVLIGFIALGLVTALLLEHGDKRIRDAGDLERHRAPAVLAVLGNAKKSKDRVVKNVVNSYLQITPVISNQISYPGTLAVIGDQSKEEVHSIAAGLALALATTGRRVCVISTSRLEGESAETLGLSDVLQDHVALGQTLTIKKFGDGRLAVMASGTEPDKMPALVQSESLKQFIDYLSAGYDLLIFAVHEGSSPVANAISGVCDQTILSVALNKETVTTVVSTANYLELRGATIAGTLLYSQSWVQASYVQLSNALDEKTESIHALGSQRAG